MAMTLRMTEPVYTALRSYHLDPAYERERISYAFGRLVRGPNGTDTVLVADPPIFLADDCYNSQSGGHVALDPDVLNSILAAFARSDCNVLVNIHDHWFSSGGTNFSSIDTQDEVKLSRYLRERFEPMLKRRPDIGRPREVMSLALVLDQSSLAARYIDRQGSFRCVVQVQIIGPFAERFATNGSAAIRPPAAEAQLRHQDFITSAQQAIIAETEFAIVGCGGLGSIIAEALLRVGARRFRLFDPDLVELHNLNRWQGGRPADVDHRKVDVLARRLRAMAGGHAQVAAIPLSVLDPRAIPQLRAADVLVGCLDNHLARYFLNRFSVQYLTPYFDAGVNIVAGDHVDFQSRYFAVIPGFTACAECTAYTLFDPDEINRGLMDEVTAEARRHAGYVEDRPEIIAAASAYPLNMRAVSTLMTELLNYFCGFRPLATCVSEVWREGRNQRSDRANHPETPDPVCAACAKLLGVGDHAELPRPQPSGHAGRLFAEARERLLSASAHSARP
jgi:molybdopterin/thiamine biosynthesis adenylyltransferase